MPARTFKAELMRPPGVGTWTFAQLPDSIVRSLALRPRQRVRGTIDRVEFRSSLLPRGGGRLFVVVNEKVREAIGKQAGDEVVFSISLDVSPVVIEIPPALSRALRKDTGARHTFEGMAPSHKKAFALWISSAKQAETVARRVERALQMLHRGETL